MKVKPMYEITNEMLEVFAEHLSSVPRFEVYESLSQYESLLLNVRAIKMSDDGRGYGIKVYSDRYLDMYVSQFLTGRGYEHENIEGVFKERANPSIQVGRGGYVRGMYSNGFCPRLFWDALYVEYQKKLAEGTEEDAWISGDN